MATDGSSAQCDARREAFQHKPKDSAEPGVAIVATDGSSAQCDARHEAFQHKPKEHGECCHHWRCRYDPRRKPVTGR